jgi:hypothetical protein
MKNPAIFFISLSLSIIISSTVNAQLEILTSGDIGIGTSEPSNIGGFDRVMEINGYNSSKIVVSNDYTSINTSLMANRWGNWGGVGTQTNHDFLIFSNNVANIVMRKEGKVNIRSYLQLGEYANTIQLSTTGYFGSANNFDFNPYKATKGMIFEQGISESSGFYCDGDYAVIWSPGDNQRLLRVYDEDGMIEKWYLDGSGYAHTISDINSKENIQAISSSLSLLKNVEGVKFNYKAEDFSSDTSQLASKLLSQEESDRESDEYDSLYTDKASIIDENKYDPSQNEYYGFIAQDVEKIFPDIVDTDEHGTMYISYDQFIPLLVEAVKEQQTEIELLRSEISLLKLESTIKSISFVNQTPTEINEAEPVLYQNIPNPYSEGTIIKYYLPDGLSEADIIIFDMTGKQMKSFSLNTPGESSIKVSSSELQPGMFMYTMVVDGKIIDTKQMILTN